MYGLNYWYKQAISNYFKIEGRATRSEYWYFQLGNFIASLLLTLVDMILFNDLVFTSLYSLFILIPSFTVSIRRLHDIDKSGWNLLFSLIPIIGVFIILYFMILPSNEHDNKYGKGNKKLNATTRENNKMYNPIEK